MTRLAQALLLAALVLALPACDSGTDNPGGGSLDGYIGNPGLLGMWEELNELDGQTTVGYEEFAEFSYSAADNEVSILEWSRESGDACWSRESLPVSAVTRTRMTVFNGIGRLYTITGDRLSIYEPSDDTDLDDLFRRSSRAAASFTPVCP